MEGCGGVVVDGMGLVLKGSEFGWENVESEGAFFVHK